MNSCPVNMLSSSRHQTHASYDVGILSINNNFSFIYSNLYNRSVLTRPIAVITVAGGVEFCSMAAMQGSI